MAEILVSHLCACRPPLLIGGFFVAAREAGSLAAWLARGVHFGQLPLLPSLHLHCSFHCFPVVPEVFEFRERVQWVLLYFGSLPHCRSIVFFPKIFGLPLTASPNLGLAHEAERQCVARMERSAMRGLFPGLRRYAPSSGLQARPYCAASFDAASSARSSSGCGMAMTL